MTSACMSTTQKGRCVLPTIFPWLPYDNLPNAAKYILPTFLGRRTVVHQASIGCPFRCTFCGVVPIYQGRQRTEDPSVQPPFWAI